MDNKQKMLAAGAAFLLTAGVAAFTYMRTTGSAKTSKPEEEKKEEVKDAVAKDAAIIQQVIKEQIAAAAEAEVAPELVPAAAADDSNWAGFTDPAFDTNRYLTKLEAESRSKLVSDVNYVLVLGLLKGGQTFNGKVTIDYTLSKVAPAYVPNGDNKECLFIDFKGKLIRSIIVNGTNMSKETENLWQNHRIYIPVEHQKVGVNQVEVEFESFYVSDCQGFQYFKDEDDCEYIYTELEPDYCHIVFPCFDQPDLKASHKSMVLAADDWAVICNSENTLQTKAVTAGSIDTDVTKALKDFGVSTDSPIVTAFGSQTFKVHHFAQTKAISTYLFCWVCGPFDCLEQSAERAQDLPHVPMRLYCRKSLTQYAENLKDDWFRITKASIRYYEQMFDTPYPFDKLDSIMCPDYAMGAMENVGCITYNDDYIPRDENFTRYKQENIFNTIAHEISHQWFGNLVTMQWWDDLWLNESFANMISYMAMDEAEGMEDVTLAWNIFLDEQYWGLSVDQKNTTHPIATYVSDTGTAQDNFDGISYGKGAAFLHQMVFFLGKDLLKEGLKTYFKKYSYKNTVLDDFIAELAAAAKKQNLDIDFTQWSNEWLTKAGCAEIELKFDQVLGEITNLRLVQTPYNSNIEGNSLKVQALNIAALDSDMKVIDTQTVRTSSTEAETVVLEFAGAKAKNQKIHAFLINEGAHGYGKFIISEMTLKALETGMHKIESSLNRKQIMNMLFDMIKSGKVPASRVMKIILNNFEHEPAVDVIQDTFRLLVPSILEKYLHSEVQSERSAQMFNLTIKMMTSGRFSEFPSVMEMLFNCAIKFSPSDDKLVYKWFVTGKVTDANDVEIQGTSINVKCRHEMLRKIYTLTSIPMRQKKVCFATLKALDSSDMIGRTEKYCSAADPDADAKRDTFMTIFEKSGEMGLQHVQEMCRGFRQGSQKVLISSFSDEWFARIEGAVNDLAWSQSRFVYLFTQPSMEATEEELAKFNALKTRLEAYTDEQKKEGTPRLLKYVKETIQEIEEKKASRELSKVWEDSQ